MSPRINTYSLVGVRLYSAARSPGAELLYPSQLTPGRCIASSLDDITNERPDHAHPIASRGGHSRIQKRNSSGMTGHWDSRTSTYTCLVEHLQVAQSPSTGLEKAWGVHHVAIKVKEAAPDWVHLREW